MAERFREMPSSRRGGARQRPKASSLRETEETTSYVSGYANPAAGGFIRGMRDSHGQGVTGVFRLDRLRQPEQRLHHNPHLRLFGPPVSHYADFNFQRRVFRQFH